MASITSSHTNRPDFCSLLSIKLHDKHSSFNPCFCKDGYEPIFFDSEALLTGTEIPITAVYYSFQKYAQADWKKTSINSHGGRINHFGRFQGCGRGTSSLLEGVTKLPATQELSALNLENYHRVPNRARVLNQLTRTEKYSMHRRFCFMFHLSQYLPAMELPSNSLLRVR